MTADLSEIRDKVLRLHILANSDSQADQQLKLKVRDAVVAEAADLFEKEHVAGEALAAAQQIAGIGNAAVLALGSDGTDGPTDAAGGVVDGASRALLEARGLRIPAILDANDAYHGLEACDGLLVTGPTGTNVNDVSVVLIDG